MKIVKSKMDDHRSKVFIWTQNKSRPSGQRSKTLDSKWNQGIWLILTIRLKLKGINGWKWTIDYRNERLGGSSKSYHFKDLRKLEGLEIKLFGANDEMTVSFPWKRLLPITRCFIPYWTDLNHFNINGWCDIRGPSIFWNPELWLVGACFFIHFNNCLVYIFSLKWSGAPC